MRRWLCAVLVGAVLVVLSMAWAPAPAQAHAVLTASSPADGATVDTPPAEVLLRFTELPGPQLAVVHVLDAAGRQVEAGRVEALAGPPPQLRLDLGVLAAGTYTATWRATSTVDGHTTVGSVAFGVGVPAVVVGTEGGAVGAQSPTPTVAGVAGRWLFYAGVVAMLGAGVVGVIVVSDPATISRRVLAAAWLAGAGGLLVMIADQRAGTGTSLANLLSSSTGHRLTAQAVAVALAGAAVALACRRPSRTALALVGVGASAAMLTRALAGHANASSMRWLGIGMQWIHLVSVGAWIGGLVWFLIAMRRGDPGRGPGLARRFSALAAGTLAVVVVSGTVRALDEVGAWSRLVGTSFGVTLLAKLGLFGAMVALGARSRLRHVPASSAGRLAGLRRVVRAEVAIAAGVLGTTALLVGLPPSASVAEAARAGPPPTVVVTGSDYATSVAVRLVVDPGTAGPNRFDLTAEDYDTGAPAPAARVSLRFQHDDRRDVAATTLELAQAPDAHWRGSSRVLSIDGRWRVTALVETPTDAVEVAMELTASVAGGPGPTASGGPSCRQGTPDPAYRVTVVPEPDPVRAEGTTFHLAVRQGDEPVTGAEVCVKADMPDMQHRGVFTVAREVAPGTYDAALQFSMTGAWEGSVIVAEPGKAAVSLPLTLEVQE